MEKCNVSDVLDKTKTKPIIKGLKEIKKLLKVCKGPTFWFCLGPPMD